MTKFIETLKKERTQHIISIGILLLTFLYIALYIISTAYFKKACMSADSAEYMKAAHALLTGHGFISNYASNDTTWFALWPIGYPALIAFFTLISGADIYLASKIFSLFAVALTLFLLYRRFGKDAWFFSLALLNPGYIWLNCYTWSEGPFTLFTLMFALSLSAVIVDDKKKAGIIDYCILGFITIANFLVRYVGAYTAPVIFAAAFVLILIYHFDKDSRTDELKAKIKGLIITASAASAFMLLYLLNNKIRNGASTGVNRAVFTDDIPTLAFSLVEALIKEFFNALLIIPPILVSDINGPKLRTLLLLLLLTIPVFIVYKKFSKKDKLLVILATGLFYYLTFITIRFNSTMDPFGPRFFEPATFVITVAILGYIAKTGFFKTVKPLIAVLIAGITLLNSLSIIKNTDFSNPYYSSLINQNKMQYEGIPEESTVAYFYWDDLYIAASYSYNYNLVSVEASDTPNTLFNKLSDYDSIYFTRAAIENYVLSDAVQLTPEMKEYLNDIYSENFENTDKNFVRIEF
ncbi:hypothetical protein QYZ88_004280 [Lachnospiraceae bacterium C1.1]|nr:hypothetical protein [Lachnospiraceae bacterium C1.1]